jgi:hypothetical protein
MRALEVVLFFELLCHTQRVHTYVRSKRRSASVGEKVRELSRSAAALDNPRVIGDLIVQQLPEDSPSCYVDERADAVEFVVIGKGSVLVKRLYFFGDVCFRFFPIRRTKQLWNIVRY